MKSFTHLKIDQILWVNHFNRVPKVAVFIEYQKDKFSAGINPRWMSLIYPRQRKMFLFLQRRKTDKKRCLIGRLNCFLRKK